MTVKTCWYETDSRFIPGHYQPAALIDLALSRGIDSHRLLRGTGLFILDAKLVFKLVDNFFGGDGRHAKIEGREFTPTEQRVVQMYYEFELSYTEIAAVLDLTDARVCQLNKAALAKMKAVLQG